MDLYALLGLTRSASAGDIERAFRRLSRRYHPGINPGDRVSATLYRQIHDAYRVLGDLERRRTYDRGDAGEPMTAAATVSFEGFDFSAAAEGPSAATFSEMFADVFQDAARRATGPDHAAALEVDLAISFEDAVRGGAFPLSIVRQERCPACGGDGRESRQPAACAACDGAGTRRWARGHMVFTATCEACHGRGHLASRPCRTCGGAGLHPRSEVVTIALPPGIDDGARVVVPARGHAVAGGTTGDLYVRVTVQPHAFFRRHGRDVHFVLPVAIHEAALGAKIDVPTLDGPAPLRVPPATASGTLLRMKGRGVPGDAGGQTPAGDLVAEVQIVLPRVTDVRSRALIEEFGRLNAADVRGHLFGR